MMKIFLKIFVFEHSSFCLKKARCAVVLQFVKREICTSTNLMQKKNYVLLQIRN